MDERLLTGRRLGGASSGWRIARPEFQRFSHDDLPIATADDGLAAQ